MFEKFAGCSEGIGKLKDFQLKVPIDSEVQPVAQPIRRVPYHLRDKLRFKLDEPVELNITEKMSEWTKLLGLTSVSGAQALR